MKQAFVSYLSGIVFAIGLGIAGMTQPAKILAFLDVAGNWDAALMWVMVAAIATTWTGYRLVFKRKEPLFAQRFYLPEKTKLEARLLVGAAIFGVGWGLGGFCPGPAVTSLVAGLPSVWIFVVFMIAGFLLVHIADPWLKF